MQYGRRGYGRYQDDDDDGNGVTPLHWIRLVLASAARRWWVVLLVAASGFAASVVYYRSRPSVYRVETMLLAQRPQALPSVVRPLFDGDPARSAWETIHRKDNLLAIVRAAKLVPAEDDPVAKRQWPAWLVRFGFLEKPGEARDPTEFMVRLLDRLLRVSVEEGTVRIQFDWPDAQQAYVVVNTALENYLAARHAQEVTAIEEVIVVLQTRTTELRTEFEAVLSQSSRRRPVVPRLPPSARAPSEELTRLSADLEAKQRALRDVEEMSRRREADLNAQLNQALNTLSEAHPTVIELRQQLALASKASPQLQALRADERAARLAYNQRAALEGAGQPTVAPSLVIDPSASQEEDQMVREARVQYEQMNSRLHEARVELDAARAAFKYRYNVIWPPQVPTDPVSPSAKKILGAGLLASLMLGLGLAAAPDVLRGRVIQRWQVERLLELPVLGEIERK